MTAIAKQLMACPKCGQNVGLTYLARHMKTCKGKQPVDLAEKKGAKS